MLAHKWPEVSIPIKNRMKVISQTGNAAKPVSIKGSMSGEGMDRPIEKNKLPLKKLAIGAVIVTIVATMGAYLFDQGSGRSLVIEINRIVISPVREGIFEDFIPIRGRVTPRKTVFLDMVEGGQVNEKLVEDGAMVKKAS